MDIFEHVGVFDTYETVLYPFLKSKHKYLDYKNHETKTRVIKIQLIIIVILDLHVSWKVMIKLSNNAILNIKVVNYNSYTTRQVIQNSIIQKIKK